MSKAALTALALGLALFGCDEAKQVEPETRASLQASVSIAAKDFDLAEVAALIEREDVRDAESLEALINADDSTINIDVDSDGKRDFIQVHELTIDGDARAEIEGSAKLEAKADPVDGALTVAGKDGQKVTFELRAVPSSKIVIEAEAETEVVTKVEAETVVVAKVDIELHEADREVVVTASYAPSLVILAGPEVEVEHRYVHHIELEHRHDHLVVVGAPFIAWVWIDVRPVYVGHVHLPPGHAKKLGLHWHHSGHPGHSGHGHGRHGGPSKIHVKSKGHGGSTKVKIKGGKGKSKGGKGKH